MRWLIIAVIIFAQQPAKAPEVKRADGEAAQVSRQTDRTNSNEQPAQPAPSPSGDNQRFSAGPKASTGKASNDADIQGKLVTFTELLVVVGFLQFFALIGQVVIYCRQAKIMARQAHEMKRSRSYMRLQWKAMGVQAGHMEGQLVQMSVQSGILQESVRVARDAAKAAQDGANAAKESADATRDSVEIFVSKERPWLRITLDDWKAIPHNDETRFIVMTFHLQRFGATDALIVNSYIYGMLTDSIDSPSATGVLGQSITMKTIITSADPAETRMTWVSKREGEWDESPTPQDVDDIYAGKKTVHVWGAINYKDVFGREHWTKFRYRWVLNPFGSNGYWEKCGKPEDNRET